MCSVRRWSRGSIVLLDRLLTEQDPRHTLYYQVLDKILKYFKDSLKVEKKWRHLSIQNCPNHNDIMASVRRTWYSAE